MNHVAGGLIINDERKSERICGKNWNSTEMKLNLLLGTWSLLACSIGLMFGRIFD
jgi:hypothetical protein